MRAKSIAFHQKRQSEWFMSVSVRYFENNATNSLKGLSGRISFLNFIVIPVKSMIFVARKCWIFISLLKTASELSFGYIEEKKQAGLEKERIRWQ